MISTEKTAKSCFSNKRRDFVHIVIKRCNVHIKSAQTVVFLAKNRDKKDEMQKFEDGFCAENTV